MAPYPPTKTFTVPVGTRLSHGIELEVLVAYLHTSDVDPDEANSKNLAPILRVDAGDTGGNGNDTAASQKAVEEHIRGTLRNHGIGVNMPGPLTNEDTPYYLLGLDKWDVANDLSVTAGGEERELAKGKPGKYRWLGLELRSPACWDVPRAYDEIRFVVNLMKTKYRVRLNTSCGLHVHVANGPRFFDPKTLKRAGAFFFAADPMLSRLHAPWRRVGPYTPSIRYISQLAHLDETRPIHAQMPTDSAAALFREERHRFPNPIWEHLPVVPWSDRTREEIDFGGKENGGMVNWERHANERVRDGPHITLSERPPTPESSRGSEDPNPRLRSSSSSSIPSSFPSSDDSDDDNGGGAHRRRLLRLMATSGFRATCFKKFSHEYPERLPVNDQYAVLAMNRCEHLFGHDSVNLLSDVQYHQLTVACAPYFEVGRSSWEWNSDRNEFTLKDAPIGERLEHPLPLALRQTNGEEVVRNLQALAAIQEAEGEQRALQQSEDGATAPDDDDDDGDEDIAVDRDLWREVYYDLIDRLMTQPTFPLDNVEGLLALFPDDVSAPKPTTDTGGSVNPPASKALAAAFPNGGTGAAPSNSSSSGDSDAPAGKAMLARVFKAPSTSSSESWDSSSDSGGEFNPPAFVAYMGLHSDENSGQEASDTDPTISSPFRSNVSPAHQNRRITSGPKLRPHDIYELPDSYIQNISLEYGFMGEQWRRISWLPYRGGPSDPEETHRRG
ncbi:hypothetical protein CHU98_g9202, partial [Xylaria longipes]